MDTVCGITSLILDAAWVYALMCFELAGSKQKFQHTILHFSIIDKTLFFGLPI